MIIKNHFLFVFIFFLALANVKAQSSFQLKQQREMLNREIELLNKSLNSTTADKVLSVKQVTVLTTKIRLQTKKITSISTEISTLNSQIYINTKEINTLNAQLKQLREDYASMVKFAYRNRNGYNKLMFVFASNDFNQAYKRLKYLQQFSESRKRKAGEIAQTQQQIGAKIAQLANNKKRKGELLVAQQEEKKELDIEKNKESKNLRVLTTQEKEYKQELTQKQKEQARLAAAYNRAVAREIEIARKEAERKRQEDAEKARKQAAAEGKPSETTTAPVATRRLSDREALLNNPESAKLAAEFTQNRGRLPWPTASSSILQGFGMHTYGVSVRVNNQGLNLRTPNGAVVRAVFSGDVISVIQIQNSYSIILKHGNYFSVYQNLKTVSVSKGQKVSTKQAIGNVAIDPAEGTSDLHFELWENATPVNPIPWLAHN